MPIPTSEQAQAPASAPAAGADPELRIIAHIDIKSTLRPHAPADRRREAAWRCVRPVPRSHGHRASAYHDQEPGWVRTRGRRYLTLNMIDTPGHVIHLYEVSCFPHVRGCGSSSSTPRRVSRPRRFANLLWLLENDLAIIPALNKIDLPGALSGTRTRSLQLIGCDESEFESPATSVRVWRTSRPHRRGRPRPRRVPRRRRRAMIFDSVRHVPRRRHLRAYVDGVLSTCQRVRMMRRAPPTPLELASPARRSLKRASAPARLATWITA